MSRLSMIKTERHVQPSNRGELYSFRLWLARRGSTYPTLSSVAMRLGPVPAGPVHSCVGAAGRFAAVCCVRRRAFRGIKSSSYAQKNAIPYVYMYIICTPTQIIKAILFREIPVYTGIQLHTHDKKVKHYEDGEARIRPEVCDSLHVCAYVQRHITKAIQLYIYICIHRYILTISRFSMIKTERQVYVHKYAMLYICVTLYASIYTHTV